MGKKIFWFGMTTTVIFVLLIGAYLFGVDRIETPNFSDLPVQSTQRIRIVVTVYPLAEFARMVAGDRAEIITLVSGLIEPHTYEPTPQDMIAARDADIFLQNGASLDGWADGIRDTLDDSSASVLVLADAALPVENATESSGISSSDPHFWLDPIIASTFLVSIRDVLIERDPDNAPAYRENTRQAMKRLSALDAAYRKRLTLCAHREIIISHDALGFLERRYGFVAYALAGFSPEDDPSPKRIAEFADLAKKRNIRYIFFEERVSPKIAETLATEADIQTSVIDLIESSDSELTVSGEGYFMSMEKNLEYLAQAMECR